MAEPTEAEVIRGGIVSWLGDVHTSLPGKVVSYDPATQRAAVTPAVQRAIPRGDGTWQHVDYPTIPSVKVGWIGGGGCSLQMPLEPGNSGWLLFSESCWAQYLESGQIAPPGDIRRFDLSYPMFLPLSLVTALRNVTGPHLEAPSGKPLTVGDNPASAQFAALSNLVATELSRINTDITTLKAATKTGLSGVPVAGTGLASAFETATAAVPSSPGSVACTRLKTQ